MINKSIKEQFDWIVLEITNFSYENFPKERLQTLRDLKIHATLVIVI